MRKFISMALMLMMVLTLLAVPAIAATVPRELIVTETNDFGTVTAPSTVLADETATIKVVAEPGYYIQSATLNGETITFTRTQSPYVSSGTTYYVPEFIVSDSDTALTHKEAWAYTIDGSALTEDANVVITYAAYTQTPVCVGDAESEGQDFSGSGTTIVTEDKKSGNASYFVASGNFDAKPFSWEAGEKYIIKWDAKAKETEVTNMYLYGMGKNSVSTSIKNRVYLHGIVIPTTWKSYTMFITAAADQTNGEVYFKAVANAYFDNLSIVKLTESAAVEPPVVEPTEFDVTITGENAVTSVAAATSEGEAVNFTVAPKFGYYIQSITIGGTPFTGFDAYKGGTYTTGAIAADTEIVVTVAALSANTFAETGEAPVTFGKVLADVATVDEFGIYLTTAEGDEVESAVTKMGPHFKAFRNINGQYAIEFQGLAA
ncbi:MAG: hypothetical protein IKB89_03415, partial [Clostridia bacterium]|nr:hypothetical protein [Clostridia bacterium]